ncbi:MULTISPECIES: (2Fe-2S)-binding protein [unclassified Paenibacillus]|uniref:(2Fe-2S)-binding protein n=1 Tax=unclassified Paenibacillus TaxID=185978 RepID=UPI000930AC91|nr:MULTISPECIES: (2Fe-2S)-binding protein [unclassified Paenibacillus]
MTIDYAFIENKFYIRKAAPLQPPLWSSPAAELLQPAVMKDFLELFAQRIKALELPVAAVYFGSWLGFLALGQQYAMSAGNTSLDLSLTNLEIMLQEHNGHTIMTFNLGAGGETSAPENACERTAWLDSSLEALYGCTLRPLLEAAAEAGGAEIGQLWGQFPTKFNYYMAYWEAEIADEALLGRVREDYRYLREEFPAEMFGRKKNPLDVKIRWIEDLKEPGKQMRMKNACCMYYRTEGGYYCYTCPRMKEEERAERREKARATAMV